ncbi:hypothetical protein HWV54_02485 [Bartonella alsatica]|uniref:Uncharacterized protein n=2 Tax=Bartonella alsatica TaxID=52764 RepID=J0Q131_9HYPH|nr:hypothetical protein [Bartonella alsatica]EJF76244.1 hypothetical protein MEC_00047 [Bartonella alsatica IBS 382]QLC51803.1 hypothetical protein HWV54_02485 [Bartonella alsatica]
MQSLDKALITKKLNGVRNDLCNHIRKIGKSGDFSLLLDTERCIVENDLFRYSNSKAKWPIALKQH